MDTSGNSSLGIQGERISGQQVRDQNALAVISVANVVKSSLGPVGLDKMLVDSIGDVTITNDGATILKLLEVEHPAAKILVELAQQQDSEVGDGTTSVVILAGELVKRANELVKSGIHPTTVISGYRLACREAVRFIQEHLNIPTEQLSKEILESCAKTCMSSKIIGMYPDFWAKLLVEAVLGCKTTSGTASSPKYPISSINILKATGKSQQESLLINGYALNCTVASQDMPRKVLNAQIACLDFNLQRMRMHTGVHITVSDPGELEAIRGQESDIVIKRLKKIIQSGANVILTTKAIDDMCQKMLIEAGIMAVRRCTKEDMRRIAKCTGATLVTSLASMEASGEESFESSLLGAAEEVSQERIGDNECIVIRGTKSTSSSLILRGANDVLLEEMERSVHDVFCALKRTFETQSVVVGGGAVECAASIYLENFATSLTSREQMAIAEYAQSLLVIPRILACNAAKDSIELVGTLRAFHNAAQNGNSLPPNAPNAASLKWFGLDLIKGEVRDNFKAGVLEPMVIKIKALKSATEACVSILRLDDFFRLAPPPKEKH